MTNQKTKKMLKLKKSDEGNSLVLANTMVKCHYKNIWKHNKMSLVQLYANETLKKIMQVVNYNIS